MAASSPHPALPWLLAVAALLPCVVGCSPVAYRARVVPEVLPPRHPLPAEARTFRVVVTPGSLEAERLADAIFVPGLRPLRDPVPAADPGQGLPPPRPTGVGGLDLPTADVTLTVGLFPAVATPPDLEEEPASLVSIGAPTPRSIFAYTGAWLIPQQLTIESRLHGAVEERSGALRREYRFDTTRGGRPFTSRKALEEEWIRSRPALASGVAHDSLTRFIAGANRIIADHFALRIATVSLPIADWHRGDPRFAEAARTFDAAAASRLSDPGRFAVALADAMSAWRGIIEQAAGDDPAGRIAAVGAATYNLAVAHFLLDELDRADSLADAASARAVQAPALAQLRSRIRDRRERLAAQASVD